MNNMYAGITLLAIAANGFSGIAALLRFKPIVLGMVKAGVGQFTETAGVNRVCVSSTD